MKGEGWARFGFTGVDLNKLKKAGLLPKAADVVIPSDEIIIVQMMAFDYYFFPLSTAGSLSPPMNSFVVSSSSMACSCISSRLTPSST
jgi:hypothetical protein